MSTGFLRQSFLTYKGLNTYLNWPAFVANVLVRPIVLVAMIGFTARYARASEGLEQFLIGMIVLTGAQILSTQVLLCFYNERTLGTLPFLFASRGSRLKSYLARGIVHLPTVGLVMAIALFSEMLMFGVRFEQANWLAVVGMLSAISLSMMGFCMFLGNFCILIRNSWFLMVLLINSLMFLLTGAVLPLSALPGAISWVGTFLPITHGVEALKGAFAGKDIALIQQNGITEVAIGAFYLVAGYVFFRYVEYRARKLGTYENN